MYERWHPMQAIVEPAPGVWEMHDSSDELYAVLRLLSIGGELGYRGVSVRDEERALVGYYTTLRAAAEATHASFIADHAPKARWANGE
jgi:hypothetical protein